MSGGDDLNTEGQFGGRVASITTSFNGAKVLPMHLNALLSQTHPLIEIIVIDNASTDATVSMLAEKYPQVTVLRLHHNMGAAGGWAEGLRYAALEKKYDWIWNFDDDSLPRADALELLLQGATQFVETSKIGMIVPLPVHEQSNTPYPPYLWKDGFVLPDDAKMKKPIWLADMAIASGALVRRDVVEQIGLPRVEFFMDFFDFEYSMRACQHGYKVVVVSSCRFPHNLGNACLVRVFGINRCWTEYPPWREYYIARNLCYAAWHLYPTLRAKAFVVRCVLRRACRLILFGHERFRTASIIVKGMCDGVRGRLGTVFTPIDKL